MDDLSELLKEFELSNKETIRDFILTELTKALNSSNKRAKERIQQIIEFLYKTYPSHLINPFIKRLNYLLRVDDEYLKKAIKYTMFIIEQI